MVLTPSRRYAELARASSFEQIWADMVNRILGFAGIGDTACIGLCPATANDSNPRFVAALAASITREHKGRVLLIAANRSQTALEGYCGVPLVPGLREMMLPPPANRLDCIHASRFQNLYVLPAGGRWGAGAGGGGNLAWVHRVVIPHFSCVVIDYPPVEESAHPEDWYAMPDAMFLLVRKRGCRRRTIRWVTRRLRQANARLAGSILHDLSPQYQDAFHVEGIG